MYKIFNKNTFKELEKYYWNANDNQKLAIEIYTYPKASKIINNFLRHNYPIKPLIVNNKMIDKEKFKTVIYILNEITKINRLNENTILFRGLNHGKFIEEWIKNNTIIENGFCSTSFDKEVALNYIDNDLDNNWLVEIYASKNTIGCFTEQYSIYDKELEFLLPKNIIFEIFKIKNNIIKVFIKNIYNNKNKIISN
ncbi:ADP-ribosyltransferase [Methanobrevibacter sp. DSM 116169]|uniref:ADP-ribosyltransferase n=1 Tax=Methanobrevibacter sp. DSM 116169 TaxID=3242727 RepID=UPI0038FBF8DF